MDISNIIKTEKEKLIKEIKCKVVQIFVAGVIAGINLLAFGADIYVSNPTGAIISALMFLLWGALAVIDSRYLIKMTELKFDFLEDLNSIQEIKLETCQSLIKKIKSIVKTQKAYEDIGGNEWLF